MVLDNTITQVEAEKWEEIRRKLYFPPCADEYSSSSKPLTDFTLEFLSEVLPSSKKPIKEGYVADLCRDGNVSPCALILGLIYIQRIARIDPAYLSRNLPGDVFLVAMVIASKYLQDEGECEALVNSEWSGVGQKEKRLLDKLEMEFLNAIDWNLYVPNAEYDLFTSFIQGRIACLEASRRGWWSYTDLISYWDSTCSVDTMKNAATHTTKTVTGSLATYLLCVTAIVSASKVTMETKQATQSLSLMDADYIPGSSLSLLSKESFTIDPTPVGGGASPAHHLYYTMEIDSIRNGHLTPEQLMGNMTQYTGLKPTTVNNPFVFESKGFTDEHYYGNFSIGWKATVFELLYCLKYCVQQSSDLVNDVIKQVRVVQTGCQKRNLIFWHLS